MPEPAPPPEAQAPRRIDGLLAASGWTVQERCQHGDLDVTTWLTWFLEQPPAAATRRL
ncbi:hypothetical protein NZK32_07925 [Cyanobium sp. FGCU-52]|nr:hypothetical protein [Cyanobium sp. FGCU52]